MLVVYMYRHTSFGQVLAQQGGMSLGWLGAQVWLRAQGCCRARRQNNILRRVGDISFGKFLHTWFWFMSDHETARQKLGLLDFWW
jgi:peptidoglycan/LPS O-acetylase OafA/YrhL